MKKRIAIAALAASMVFSMTGCGALRAAYMIGSAIHESSKESDAGSKSDKKEKRENDSHGKADKVKETLMVYMVGSDLESQIGAATHDLQEMAISGYDPDEMNVVVCAGGAHKWWNTSVDGDGLSMYIMEDEDIKPVYDFENDNMADSDTLQEFINEAKAEYPADNYSLLLWNHGGGAVLGYGVDETHDNQMLSVSQLGDAINGSDVCDDGKFEWIGFDACMMGMVEVANELKDSANYMIASEEVEAQDGWDYSALGEITDKDAFAGDEAGEIITEAFGRYYDDNYKYVPDYTLACIDMSKVSDVTDAITDFAKKADGALGNGDYSKIARARDNAKAFGNSANASMFDYIDLGSFSRQIEDIYPDEAEAIEDALDECVVHNVTNIKRASGISVYFPYDNVESMDKMVKSYDEEKYNEDYLSFIHNFTTRLRGDSLTDWNVSKSEPVKAQDSDTGYSVQLSEKETENFSKAYTSVWEKDPDDEKGESYMFWLDSSNATLDKDGKLSTDFDGRIFFLTDGSGKKTPIYATQIESTEDYSEYVTIVMKGDLDDPDIHNVDVHIRVDKDHPNGVITGIYRSMKGGDLSYPDKKVEELKEGDFITISRFARKIKFDDNGKDQPFDTWETSSFISDQFEIKGDLGVSFEKPEESHDYLGLFNIRDTQGKSHYTNYIDIHVD